mgnify:CR=1 FL=1
MKKLLFFLRLFFALCVIIFVLTINLPEIKAEDIFDEVELNIDSSIVLLTITDGSQEIYSDPFFQILNFTEKNYYLIPVTLLNPYLDMDLRLVRETGQLIIKNKVRKLEKLILKTVNQEPGRKLIIRI